MTMITIGDTGPAIDSPRISAIESKAGRPLPGDYLQFLLTNNGGYPTPDTIDITPAPGSPTDVQTFFGIGRDVESSEIAWNIDLMRQRFPDKRLFPIACDSGGNIFCLDLFNEFGGGVIYCDMEGEVVKTYSIAADFEAFTAKIRDF